MRKLQIMGLGRTDWEKLQRILGSLGTQDPCKLGRGQKWQNSNQQWLPGKSSCDHQVKKRSGVWIKGVMRQHFPIKMQKVVL